jgi:hypothetical protein
MTGFTLPAVVNLFQNYLDCSGDVQTCALALSSCPDVILQQTDLVAVENARIKLSEWTDM